MTPSRTLAATEIEKLQELTIPCTQNKGMQSAKIAALRLAIFAADARHNAAITTA